MRVLNELYSICTGDENKPSDKIAAAKLFLDNTPEEEQKAEEGLRVIFEGEGGEFAK